jgi:hypothetical protein
MESLYRAFQFHWTQQLGRPCLRLFILHLF